jgi:hypothetical protein
MSFDKEAYWKDKEFNIGSVRNKKKNKNIFNKLGHTTLHRDPPKKPSKYAIRKNTKRFTKFNKYQEER